jgi:hypothetical protein
VRPVSVPGLEYYYLTHALLELADAYESAPSQTLEAMIDVLRRAPETVVRVYVLDEEMQILLLWLMRVAGLERLKIDTNAPEIADRWNQKAPLHPSVDLASGMPRATESRDPAGILRADSRLTRFARELGISPARVPGYTIETGLGDADVVAAQVRQAAALLRTRYGLSLGCFKPARAGTGARIRVGVRLDDEARLAQLAAEAMTSDEDYVLEAQVEYLRTRLGDHEFIVAPSAHVRDGLVADGATLQFMRGTVWQGNVYFDGATCEDAGLSAVRYRGIRTEMQAFVDALRPHGLVKGGVDFAVGRIGGRFGNAILVGMQDLNLAAYGAEYLRVFRDRVSDPYAATKVVRPSAEGTLPALEAFVDGDVDADAGATRIITSVPGRWGLIAVARRHPALATENVLALERRLTADGLLQAETS